MYPGEWLSNLVRSSGCIFINRLNQLAALRCDSQSSQELMSGSGEHFYIGDLYLTATCYLGRSHNATIE